MALRTCLYLLFCLPWISDGWAQVSVQTRCYQINTGADDAEEYIFPEEPSIAKGTVELGSVTLELVDDPGYGGAGQLTGLRFSGIEIPKGANITEAYIQFTVADLGEIHGPEMAEGNLVIRGEASANAPPFIAEINNLSDRTFTASRVPWNLIPAWNTTGAATLAQRTPDLSPIIQEIVDQQQWITGNALSFLIEGKGRRMAVAYDSNPFRAPKLCVTYSNCPPAGTVCDDGDSYTTGDQHDGQCDCRGVPRQGNLCLPITNGLNDAEQLEDGSILLNSTDLELVLGGQEGQAIGNQIVGLRFDKLPLPQGASISEAYLQFSAHAVDAETTSLTIRAEAADDSAPFTILENDIGDRNTTVAAVSWDNIPAWSLIGEAAADQRTPDLSVVIEAVIGRDGWRAGHALTFLISGSGRRTAASFEGAPEQAVQLCLSYSACPPKGTVCDDGRDDTYDDFEDGQCNCAGVSVSANGTFTHSRIAGGSDDAEEFSNGTVLLNSTDLDLVDDPEEGGAGQVVGLRFDNVLVPNRHQGLPDYPIAVEVVEAWIQFTSDNLATDSDPVSLTIAGELSGNAVPFTTEPFNLSGRTRTTSSVNYTALPAWDIPGDRGGAQQLDVTEIVNEIISRPDWNAGNAMGFLITGTGTRTAEAYDDLPAEAAELHVTFLTGFTPELNSCGGRDCFYFADCGITPGGTVQLSCDDDLSDAALAQRFAYESVGHLIQGCNECSTIKTPVLKRSGTSSIKSQTPEPDKALTNGSVCYTEQLVWDYLCADRTRLTSLSVTIEVVDYQPPSFELPSDRLLSCADNIYDLSLTGNISQVFDNCGVADICYEDTFLDDNNQGLNCSLETVLMRTWRVIDNCGNETSKTQIIRILPFVSVITDCLLVDNSCGIVNGQTIRKTCTEDLTDEYLQATYGVCLSSNCDPGSTPVFSRRRMGTVKVPVDDCGGDYCVLYREALQWIFPSESFYLVLEVVDLTAPSFTAPPDMHVYCDEIHDLSVTGTPTDLSDDCGQPTVSYEDDQDVSDCMQETVITRTWILQDPCGNQTRGTQLITVYPRGCTSGSDTLTLSGPVAAENYYANTVLQSDGVIGAGATVRFFSGERITLLPGFQVQSTASFSASILDCNENVPVNDLCINAIPLTCNTRYVGTNQYATRADSYLLPDTGHPFCDPHPLAETGPESGVWFYFQAGLSGTVQVNSSERIRLFRGGCSALEYLDCNDYEGDGIFNNIVGIPLDFSVGQGQEYWIYLDGLYGETGVYSIELLCSQNAVQPETAAVIAEALTAEETNHLSPQEKDQLLVFPNPAQTFATIQFQMAEAGSAQLVLIELTGRQVRTLREKSPADAGWHQLLLDQDLMRKGIYFIQLRTDRRVISRKLVIQ